MKKIQVKTWDDAQQVIVQIGWHGPTTNERSCLGSGVIVGPSHVLTALHVIEAIDARSKHLAVWALDRGYVPSKWRARCRTITRRDPLGSRDLCLLSLNESLSEGASFGYELASTTLTKTLPKTSDAVDAYACPATMLTGASNQFYIACPGMLYMRRHVIDADLHEILVTHPNMHGMSGGGLFDKDGALIGIASRSHAQEDTCFSPSQFMTGFSQYMGIDDVVDDINSFM